MTFVCDLLEFADFSKKSECNYTLNFIILVLYSLAMYLFSHIHNMLLFVNIFISKNDVSHTSFGIFADKQAGKNIRDICSLQITSSRDVTLINFIHHRLF